MADSPLTQAVDAFARAIVGASDAELERAWTWKAHDEEGVRFACFVTYQELSALAVAIESERAHAMRPYEPSLGEGAARAQTRAQRILAQWDAAYWDLLSLLIGISNAEIDREPAPGEWPLRVVLDHTIGTEFGFLALCRYAVERVRAGDDRPKAMPEPSAEERDQFDTTFERGTLAEILALYQRIHADGLRDMAELTDDELRAPSLWWEGYDVEVAYRLHRCDAHLRQHTIQVEKTLAGIGRPPREAERLVHMVYWALARCQGALIGAPETLAAAQAELARAIAGRAKEVAVALG